MNAVWNSAYRWTFIDSNYADTVYTNSATARTILRNYITADFFDDNSIIAYYNFENDVLDKSGNGYDLTWGGTAAYTTGVIGNGAQTLSANSSFLQSTYEFLSRTDNVAYDTAVTGYNTTTFCAFVYYNNTDFIVYNTGSTANGYGIGIKNNNIYVANQNDSTISTYSSTITLSPNTWYHLCFIFDATDASTSIYLNGKYVDKFIPSVTVGDRGAWLLISGDGYGGVTFYDDTNTHYNDGIIDNYRVFNRILTADEISHLYKVEWYARN